MKISFKIIAATLIPVVIFIVILLTYILISFRTSLKDQSSQSAINEVSALANLLDSKNLEAVNTAKVMATMQENGGFGKRKMALDFSREILTKYPQFQGAYFGYEPNADGLDAEEKSKDCCTKGRFLPYNYRDKGSIAIAPLLDMETSLYYQGTKEKWMKLDQNNPDKKELWMITEPYIYDGVPIVEQTFPIVIDGKFVGIAGVDRLLDELFSIVATFKPFNSSKTFLISRLNKFITTTHNKEKMSMKHLKDFPEYEKAILPLRGKNTPGIMESPDLGTDDSTYLIYSPIKTGDWLLVMTVNESDLFAAANSVFWRSLMISIVFLAVVVLFINFSIRSIVVQPIRKVGLKLQDIAEGESDLTKRLDIVSSDEIGDLAKWFNLFMDSLKETIQDIQNMVNLVDKISENLEDSFNQILATCESMSRDTDSSSSAINETVQSIQLLSKALSDSSVEMQKLSKIAEVSEHSMVEASEALVKSNQSIQNIEQSSDKIGGIIDVITDISNQTNLLSLNAAIEAAKAGEYGKGFAVVAEEVRELADRSNKSVVEIKELISISSQNVKDGNLIMNQAGKVLTEIISNVNKMTEPIKQVSNSIQEQENGIQEMEKATEEILTGSENNASAVVELTDTVKSSSDNINDLNDKASDLKQKIFRFKL